MKQIDGQLFLSMLKNAAAALYVNREKLNRMNVFPVPDGDTGVNMYATVSSIFDVHSESKSIGEISQLVSDAMLRSSRGNSGTILATFFIGVAKAYEGKEVITPIEMIQGFKAGQKSSYSMILSPQEGTILTVMKETSKVKVDVETFEELFDKIMQTAKTTLDKTPELLPVLKTAGVVDSGAFGFFIMLDAMKKTLSGEMFELDETQINDKQANFKDFEEEEYDFAYCCEAVIEKDEKYRGFDKAIALKKDIGKFGSSEVFVETNKIIKFHIHVNEPERILELAANYGNVTTWKVDNMMAQMTEMKAEKKEIALIPVVIGDGFEQLFLDSGATEVINGGSTLNVSFQQIKDGIDKANSKVVFLFPNNKDTIATCVLVSKTIKEPKIIVVPSINMAQSIACLSAFDDEASVESNELNFLRVLGKTAGYAITQAAKSSVVNNVNVSKDDFMVICNGKIIASFSDEHDAFKCLSSMILKFDCATVYYGNDVSEELANEYGDLLTNEIGDNTEVMVVYGGQNIYRFLICGE